MEKQKKERKVKVPKAPKEKKAAPTEAELVLRQGNKMHSDMMRLQATQTKSADKKEMRTSVDLWKDTDFFVSIVFQSSKQKLKFVEEFSKKFGLGLDTVSAGDEIFQIFNGLILAEKLGIRLEPETKTGTHPYPNLELAKLTLDDVEF